MSTSTKRICFSSINNHFCLIIMKRLQGSMNQKHVERNKEKKVQDLNLKRF